MRHKPKVDSRLWRRRKKAAGINHPTAHLSIKDMQDLRRQEKQTYAAAKRDHQNLRKTFTDLVAGQAIVATEKLALEPLQFMAIL